MQKLLHLINIYKEKRSEKKKIFFDFGIYKNFIYKKLQVEFERK